MRRLVLLAGIALVTVGAVGVVAYLVDVVSSDSDGPAAQPSPSPSSALTEDEHQQVIDLTLDDSRIQALLADTEYTIEDVAMWTEEGHTEKVNGAVITIALNQPVSVPLTDWPQIRDDPQDPRSYTTTTVRYGADDVKQILVFVDFTRGVVQIQPFEYARLNLPPDATPQTSPTSSD